MKKFTFTLDDETVRELDRTAERLGMAKSRVVREAIRVYGEESARTSDAERTRLLEAFDTLVAKVPDRPRREVDAEQEAVRAARSAGRAHRGRP